MDKNRSNMKGFLTIQSMAYREVNDQYRVSRHVHRTFQWYLVLHGRVRAKVGDQEVSLGPKQAILVPPEMTRQYQAGSRSPGYFQAVFQNHALRLNALSERVVTLPHPLMVHVNDLIQEGREPGPDSELLTSVLVARILLGLRREVMVQQKQGSGKQAKDPLVMEQRTELHRRVEVFMARNHHRPLTREDVAHAVHLSAAHLARLFRAATGKTLHERLTEIRLEHSRVLLRESTVPITRIALEVGFNSFSHFTQTFKKCVGVSPSDYRRAGGGTWRRSFSKTELEWTDRKPKPQGAK